MRHKAMKTLVLSFFIIAGMGAFADLPNWTVTWTNDTHDAGLAANDQNALVLRVYRNSSRKNGFGLVVGTQATKPSGEKYDVPGSGVASSGGVAEYLDMRGSVTGLDYRADPATNAVWQFAYLRNYCFRPGYEDGVTESPAAYISGLRTPGTLDSDGWTGVFHIDSGANSNRTTEIIVDEPNYTGIVGSWGLNGVGGLKNLIFKCPKATGLSGPVSHATGRWTTDITETWDLSSVTYVGANSDNDKCGTYTGPFPSGAVGMRGILRLPALVRIAAGQKFDKGVFLTSSAAFYNCGMGEVELGLNGNLQFISCYSFLDCGNLTNVVIGTAVGKTLTICTNAFRCAGLKTIYFNGDKPTFKSAYNASSPAFGKDQAEGTMTFYVRDIPSWADVLAEADANGGLVSGEKLNTKNRQRVVRFSGYRKVTFELQDPRFADIYHETATITTTGPSCGVWRSGEITLSASCSEPDDAATDPRRAKFLRWDGVPREYERQNPVTFLPKKNMTVRAVFAHDWLMSDTAEPGRTMDNRFWRVTCYKRDGHNLGLGRASDKVGKGMMWPEDPAQRMGGGDLNLNGDIWDSAGEKWTLVSSCDTACWLVYNDDEKKWGCPTLGSLAAGEVNLLPTRLTLPESLKIWYGELHNYDSWGAWPIKEIIAICPEAEGTIGQFTIGGCSGVKRLVLRTPKLTKFGSGTYFGFSWCGSTYSETDFGEWDLSGITTVANEGFSGAVDIAATGTLSLPNVVNVGSNAFYRLTKLTGLVLGTNKLSVAQFGPLAMNLLKSVTSLTLGTKGLTVGDEAFAGLTALKELHLPGRALDTATMDALVTAIPEQTADKQLTIYCSPFSHWTKLAASLTADEEAVAPENCFGVYREGLRKAWFVTECSIFEPKGMFIIVK